MSVELVKGASIWEALRKPFADDDIEWRVSRCGKKDSKVWAVLVPYLNARAIMNRLDETVGPDGWRDEYREITNGAEYGLICQLNVRYDATPGAEQWVWKEDGAGFSEIESIKGGFSDSLKRAAVKFGMGRFLYDLDEVTIFNDQINEGYPPKGKPAVAIRSAKDNITAWCEPPKVSEIMAREVKPTPKTESRPTPIVTPAFDERVMLEKEIGRLATIIGADSVTAARTQVAKLREDAKAGTLAHSEHVNKLREFRISLESLVADKQVM